ncbi:MAG: hypothetical protein JWR77_2229, partial [Rhizorhabdus sp.]|nr:hypothetical protein [Rhizorhabdus sp.]
MKSALLAASMISLMALPAAAKAPAPVIAAAVADAGRPAKDVALDASRRPAELIAFAGVKPGAVVMDVWPGGGYWTRIFSKLVGPKGK